VPRHSRARRRKSKTSGRADEQQVPSNRRVATDRRDGGFDATRSPGVRAPRRDGLRGRREGRGPDEDGEAVRGPRARSSSRAAATATYLDPDS